MKILKLILILSFAILYGCKDDGFEPYKELKETGITFPLDTTFTVAQLEVLQVSPIITGLEEDSNYSYEWKLYSGSEIQILSTERDLEKEIALAPGSYSMQFSVINNKSKVKTISKLYNLRVNGAFYEGWIVGNNVNNKGFLSFIRADDKVFLSPLDDINQTQYPNKIIAAYSGVLLNMWGDGFSQLFYFTDNGLTIFDPETMLQISEVNDYFYRPMSFTSKPAYGTNGLFMDQYLINEGDLYMADGPGFIGNTDFGTYSERIDGDYQMFPFIFPDDFANTYFYDNKNKRFLSASYQERELSTPSTTTSNDQYNLNNIGKIMLGADVTVRNNYLGLMQSGANYYLYAFNLYSGAESGYFTQLSSAPEADQLKAFAASSKYEHAYYATSNSIYKVVAASGVVTKLYGFSGGGEIVDMKMLKNGTDANKMLAIAINNGEQGEVHYIYLDDLGNLDASRTPKVIPGFGKITNLSYRLPS